MYNVGKITKNISINIYALRKRHHMSARALGACIGKSECTVTAWERGEINPSFETILKICNVFSCTLDEFLAAEMTPELVQLANCNDL